nr:hypothetical protein Q903MT_gene3159 [Picea sitchensis]
MTCYETLGLACLAWFTIERALPARTCKGDLEPSPLLRLRGRGISLLVREDKKVRKGPIRKGC